MNSYTPKIWRIVDVLKWSKDYLKGKGVESPQIEVEWILRDILKCSRLDIYLKHDRPLSKEEISKFKKLLIKRASGTPIQYVIGYAEFMGLNFKVTPSVLIPRPETEVLVEKVLEVLRKDRWKKPVILDVGTGSGNIAISLAVKYSNCLVLGLDISSEVLEIAKLNATDNYVSGRVDFIKMDILKESPQSKRRFNIVVSNPPYVAGEWFRNLPEIVRKHEPVQALYPGKDELIFYRRLGKLANKLLSPDGIMIVEIGGTYQEENVKNAFKKYNLGDFETVEDYLGQSRCIVARLNKW